MPPRQGLGVPASAPSTLASVVVGDVLASGKTGGALRQGRGAAASVRTETLRQARAGLSQSA